MQLVLVGDDGSGPAARAVAWATSFAGERGAQLLGVRVTATENDVTATENDVTATENDVTATEGVELVTVRDRHPAAAIMEIAADHDADLIVLGRRGRGGFPSLPIGTTAHHVAAASGRPVVVVPQVDVPAPGPLIRRVVIGLDGMPGSTVAATWAARNCSAAQFTAVHALELAPAFAQFDDHTATEMYEKARERAVSLMRDSWCRPLIEAAIAFDAIVEEGGPAEVIIGTAARTEADLVVLGRRDHGLLRGTLGGVSQRVLAYAPCSAAIVSTPPAQP